MMSYSYRAVRGKDIKMLSILDPGVKRTGKDTVGDGTWEPGGPSLPGNFLGKATGKAKLLEHTSFLNS